MTPVYFDTRFKLGLPLSELPDSFAIITAYATTGEVWTGEDNHAASDALRAELEQGGKLIGTITGYSPATQHAEPGYAAALEFEEACKMGVRFKQDAIYFVSSGTLFVSHCDHRRSLKPVAQFAKRVDPSG
ncbi:DUF3293 domain-containing protein [Prosthecobacter sp.]|uniref:DUF3293 domain-containing protein n=1 Tax=Prosthecobacter sp. TaxID=1965333 RepID=UPI001E0D1B1D|nr:DUF3293 domain-containing protein [Prosthecobacter sp.]MCB1279276.1 DUF3293 domain-containing protein [Prosthecobacter sp.]